MDIGSIFLILALLIGVILFIGRPFVEHTGKEKLLAQQLLRDKEAKRSTLLAERDRILSALQELDADANLGKIPEDDYINQRAAMMRSGADILRQLDALQITEALPSQKPAMPAEKDELEELIAARRSSQQRKSSCLTCGQALNHGDQFCTHCGVRIDAA